MQKFHCIGGACELNCCQNWTITIDKSTYRKYMACPDPELKAKLVKSLKRYQQGNAYAFIVVDKQTGVCPFLNEKGLCEIQLSMGEEALSHTCTNYPRSNNTMKIYDVKLLKGERSLLPSCPEAARQILLNPDPMRFETVSGEINAKTGIGNVLDIPTQEDYNTFMAIRSYMFEILQDRRFAFRDRLVLLGMYIQKLTVTEFLDVPTIIEYYRKLFSSPDIAGQLAALPNQPDMQFALINRMFFLLFQKNQWEDYQKLINDVLKGLGADIKLSEKEQTTNYLNASASFKKQSAQWDHLFENYFVNDVFQKPLPLLGLNETSPDYHTNGALWHYYIYLCTTYLLLNVHFAGINALNGNINEEDAIRIMFLFSRAVFQHDKNFFNNLLEWFKSSNFDQLGNMIVAIRT